MTQTEIRHEFADGWEVESIEPTELHVTVRDEPAHAWVATIRKT